MGYKNPILPRGELQHLWIGDSVKLGRVSTLKINGGFLAKHTFAN